MKVIQISTKFHDHDTTHMLKIKQQVEHHVQALIWFSCREIKEKEKKQRLETRAEVASLLLFDVRMAKLYFESPSNLPSYHIFLWQNMMACFCNSKYCNGWIWERTKHCTLPWGLIMLTVISRYVEWHVCRTACCDFSMPSQCYPILRSNIGLHSCKQGYTRSRISFLVLRDAVCYMEIILLQDSGFKRTTDLANDKCYIWIVFCVRIDIMLLFCRLEWR